MPDVWCRMLSSEFSAEMGALIRSLETKIRLEPELAQADERDALDQLERAIVALVGVYLSIKQRPSS